MQIVRGGSRPVGNREEALSTGSCPGGNFQAGSCSVGVLRLRVVRFGVVGMGAIWVELFVWEFSGWKFSGWELPRWELSGWELICYSCPGAGCSVRVIRLPWWTPIEIIVYKKYTSISVLAILLNEQIFTRILKRYFALYSLKIHMKMCQFTRIAMTSLNVSFLTDIYLRVIWRYIHKILVTKIRFTISLFFTITFII